MTKTVIVEVLVPVPLNNGFFYLSNINLENGDIVLVPFRNKKVYGLVTKELVSENQNIDKLKFVIKKHKTLKLEKKFITFLEWVSNYNLAYLGKVLKLSINTLNVTKEKYISENIYYLNSQKESSKLTEKQKKIVTFLSEKTLPSLQSELLEKLGVSISVINSLCKKNILNKEKHLSQKQETKIIHNYNEDIVALSKLSSEQNSKADFLLKEINENQYSCNLLHGVTGSGKTEIYFYLVNKILRQDKQILLLLPEINLTTQLIKRFENIFKFTPAVWHSKISNSKKKEILLSVYNKNIKIIIGARSALFLPFKQLSLIIVDEEHDSSFKQEEVINYHGRDMAIVRAKIENIPILLSSATPSLESLVNSRNGKYNYLRLLDKFSQKKVTNINLINLKKESLGKNKYISEVLRKAIENNLKNRKQSLLFMNRRGYASLSLCKKCGHKIHCKNCSSYLTFHKIYSKLICHYCGYNIYYLNKCKNCKEEDSLISLGTGVEKIKEEIVSYFPSAKLAVISSDSVNSINIAEIVINKIVNNEIDIIIGTQMIAKGYNFPHLALVGIIDADLNFFGSGLKSFERSYQLLTQIIGRVGRDKYDGEVHLQTYNPESSIFKYILENDQEKFFEQEIRNRKDVNMPPFTKITEVIFSSKKENIALINAKLLIEYLLDYRKVNSFGPAPMPVTKKNNKYYYRVIMQSSKNYNIQDLLRNILPKLENNKLIDIRVNIDPD